MKRLRFEYKTSLEFSENVTGHCFALRCIPFSDERQTITEDFCEITPNMGKLWHSRDSFGNLLVCGRMDFLHDNFSFKVSGVANIVNSGETVGEAAPYYRFFTPLTTAGERISAFYECCKPSSTGMLSRAMEISEILYNSMTYVRGVTGTQTTAEQAMTQLSGVCQDYAHILLSLLRIEKIPCRYVSGLAFESGETHAWVEVFEDGRWTRIDPTQNRLIGDSYIKLCHGRDYSDCPIERGIYIGNAQSVQTVFSKMTEI